MGRKDNRQRLRNSGKKKTRKGCKANQHTVECDVPVISSDEDVPLLSLVRNGVNKSNENVSNENVSHAGVILHGL